MPSLQNSWRSILRAGSRRQSSFREELPQKSVDFCFYPALLEEGAGGQEEQGLGGVSAVLGIDAQGGTWLWQAELGTARSCQAQPFRGDELLLIPS